MTKLHTRQIRLLTIPYGQLSFYLWQHPLAYGIFISQLKLYYQTLSKTFCTVLQDYVPSRLKSLFLHKSYWCHYELLDQYGVFICTMTTDLFTVIEYLFPLSGLVFWYQDINIKNYFITPDQTITNMFSLHQSTSLHA